MVENPAITELLAIFKRFVDIDEDVENKTLFLKIAKDILSGKKATFIAFKYHLSELTIIGIRRKLLDCFEEQIVENKSTDIEYHLKNTKFWDTFNEKWTSPKYREYVTNRGIDEFTELDPSTTVQEEYVKRMNAKLSEYQKIRITKPNLNLPKTTPHLIKLRRNVV